VLAELNLTDEIRDTLKLHVRRRLAPQAVKIRADFEVRCFTEEGIDAIKEALTAGEIASTEDVAVKIRLVAPPM
jgi:translation initiation factor 2 subunit 1